VIKRSLGASVACDKSFHVMRCAVFTVEGCGDRADELWFARLTRSEMAMKVRNEAWGHAVPYEVELPLPSSQASSDLMREVH
jgi:hypothetical protein